MPSSCTIKFSAPLLSAELSILVFIHFDFYLFLFILSFFIFFTAGRILRELPPPDSALCSKTFRNVLVDNAESSVASLQQAYNAMPEITGIV